MLINRITRPRAILNPLVTISNPVRVQVYFFSKERNENCKEHETLQENKQKKKNNLQILCLTKKRRKNPE